MLDDNHYVVCIPCPSITSVLMFWITGNSGSTDTYDECAIVQELVDVGESGKNYWLNSFILLLIKTFFCQGTATAMCAMVDFVAICPASCAALGWS